MRPVLACNAALHVMLQRLQIIRAIMQVSMFLLDSVMVDSVGKTFAQRLRQAFIQDSHTAMETGPHKFACAHDKTSTSYPSCLFLEPGPALSQALHHVLPVLHSHNEAAAIADHLSLYEALPLPTQLRNPALASHLRRNNGTLDLVAGLGDATPPATLSRITPSLTACLPHCPPITHLRVPPGAFISHSTLQPLLPFLQSITRLTTSAPEDTRAILGIGLAGHLPRLSSIASHPCHIRNPYILTHPPLPTSAPTSACTSTQPPDAPDPSSTSSSTQKLLALEMSAPSLYAPLPIPMSLLPDLSHLAVSALPDPQAASIRADTRMLRALPRCSRLTQLRLTDLFRQSSLDLPASPFVSPAWQSALESLPLPLQRLDLHDVSCPLPACMLLSRLTALRHLSIRATPIATELLQRLPCLSRVELLVDTNMLETPVLRAALDAESIESVWVRSCRAAPPLWRSSAGEDARLESAEGMIWAPPGLADALLCRLVRDKREFRLIGAGDEVRADAQFAAVTRDASCGAGGAGAGVPRRLQLPLHAFLRVLEMRRFWEHSADCRCGGGTHACVPAAPLRGVEELAVRKYAGLDKGVFGSEALRAVGSLTALQRLVLGGVEGACATLRALRVLPGLTALSLPSTTATCADAGGLAAAVGALTALRELFVDLDFPPPLWQHALAGFKPRARDQASAHAETEQAVAAAVEALLRQCRGGLRQLQEGSRPLRRLELTASSSASDEFVMWLLSSGVGHCARI